MRNQCRVVQILWLFTFWSLWIRTRQHNNNSDRKKIIATSHWLIHYILCTSFKIWNRQRYRIRSHFKETSTVVIKTIIFLSHLPGRLTLLSNMNAFNFCVTNGSTFIFGEIFKRLMMCKRFIHQTKISFIKFKLELYQGTSSCLKKSLKNVFFSLSFIYCLFYHSFTCYTYGQTIEKTFFFVKKIMFLHNHPFHNKCGEL